MGALTLAMFICRFFLFHLFESPKVSEQDMDDPLFNNRH